MVPIEDSTALTDLARGLVVSSQSRMTAKAYPAAGRMRRLGAAALNRHQKGGTLEALPFLYVPPNGRDDRRCEMGYRYGDEIEVLIDRDGLGMDEGIAHMPDETMVVVAGAGGKVGERVRATVLTVVQTPLGPSVRANAEG